MATDTRTAADWRAQAVETADRLADELERGAVCAHLDGDAEAEIALRFALVRALQLHRHLTETHGKLKP